jgi:hypothetical protein
VIDPAHLLDVVADPDAEIAIQPPGDGPGFWAGGPSAVFQDGVFHLAYRLRRPVTEGRGYANVVARSLDGVHFETVATVTSAQFECASLERPALVPLADGGWRLYVSCSTADSKHWWVEAIEAADIADLADGKRTVILPGDDVTAWKDPVIARDGDTWRMWACRHPLDGGDDEADRMTSVLFTSADGLGWTEAGPALVPTPGAWDGRGTRITSVLSEADEWFASYDGRASAAENWFERTGIAGGSDPGALRSVAGPTPPGRTVRYVSLADTGAGLRLYWEASRSDGANALRTAYVPRPVSPSQS